MPDQLGSEKAPVRLAGLYALERVGIGASDQRATIVNVICAYLRMPHTPPAEGQSEDVFERRQQEQQVRLTAQRILNRHLSTLIEVSGKNAHRWESLHIDLTNADLRGADFAQSDLAHADFAGADLTGALLTSATLENAKFAAANLTRADLRNALAMKADFSGADLTGAKLTGATLKDADLDGADLTDAVMDRVVR